MLFKKIPKEELKALVGQILETTEVIGPVKVTENVKGKPIHEFRAIKSFSDIDLTYETTALSAKTYFLPFKETLSTFKFADNDWMQQISYWKTPRAIIGMHACDINGLLKLDKVFTKEVFPSPYYLARRNNTFIVGIDHNPCDGGFCRSLGTDTTNRGFDLFLTDLRDCYYVAVGSDKGFNALQKIKSQDVTEEDNQAYLAKRQDIVKKFETKVDVQDLPNVLDIEFKSSVWKKYGDKCLSCGTCAMVCPTCYCYGISEDVAMDFSTSSKIKQLYSCNILDFAMVAGGHNFRESRDTRLKYRYYHQHRGFVESYGEPKCVGCNRCGRACLAGIDPKDVINEIQAEV